MGDINGFCRAMRKDIFDGFSVAFGMFVLWVLTVSFIANHHEDLMQENERLIQLNDGLKQQIVMQYETIESRERTIKYLELFVKNLTEQNEKYFECIGL